MPKPEISLKRLAQLFTQSSAKIFKRSEIQKLFHESELAPHISQSFTIQEILNLMLKKTKLSEIKLKFPSQNTQGG
jgi:hypothetical protein